MVEIVNPQDVGLFAALRGARVPVPSPDALRVYGEEEGRTEIQAMGEDLGVLAAGEGFMGRDPAVFPLEVSLALWKRLKVLETGFNLLADQKLASRGGCNCPCRPAA